MQTFGRKKILVGAAWFFWLIFTAFMAKNHFEQPDFRVALWVLPAIGFLLCVGVVIWALIESDRDLIWKDFPSAKVEDVESAKESLAKFLNDTNVALVNEPKIEFSKGPRIHGWGGWRRRIEGFVPILAFMSCFYLVHFPRMLFKGTEPREILSELRLYLVLYLPFLVMGIVYYVHRFRVKAIYDNPLVRIDSLTTKFRDLNFYQFQCAAAKQLGFSAQGDFRQSGFDRSIFVNDDQSVAIEIGVEGGIVCFKIISATGSGKLLQTATNGNTRESEKEMCKIVPPLWNADGKMRWKSMATTLSRHLVWVSTYLEENEEQELAVLNEQNLGLVLRESRSKSVIDIH